VFPADLADFRRFSGANVSRRSRRFTQVFWSECFPQISQIYADFLERVLRIHFRPLNAESSGGVQTWLMERLCE